MGRKEGSACEEGSEGRGIYIRWVVGGSAEKQRAGQRGGRLTRTSHAKPRRVDAIPDWGVAKPERGGATERRAPLAVLFFTKYYFRFYIIPIFIYLYLFL